MFEKIRTFLLENQTIRQTIIKNTFWLSFGELLGRLLRAGVVIYAARILGAERWGVFSYAITFAAMFTIFSDIGLSSVLTREVARDKENQKKYFSTILAIKSVLIIAFFLAIMFAVPSVSRMKLSTSLLFLAGLTFIFDSLGNFADGLFRATERMEQEALTNIFTQAGILVFGLGLLIIHASPENLALAYAIGSLGGLLVALFFLRPFLKEILSHFDKSLIRPLIAAAWPFGLVGVLGAIMINTDTIIIGWFEQAKEVGFYSAAQKPILLLYMAPTLIARAFFPTFSRLAQNEHEKFRSLLENGLSFVFLLALPFAVGIFMTADQIVYLFYGIDYAPAIVTTKILAATIITAYPASLLGNAIFAYNLRKTLIAYSMIGAIGNVFFDLLLIPVWGINGAAIATIFTQILSGGFIWMKMKSINNFTVIEKLGKVAAATILMAVFLAFFKTLQTSVLITIPLGGTFYLLTLFVLREKSILELRKSLRFLPD